MAPYSTISGIAVNHPLRPNLVNHLQNETPVMLMKNCGGIEPGYAPLIHHPFMVLGPGLQDREENGPGDVILLHILLSEESRMLEDVLPLNSQMHPRSVGNAIVHELDG